MRTIALEEHLTFPEFTKRIPEHLQAGHSALRSPAIEKLAPLLADINNERIRSMDENGISMQVLSVSGLGADLLGPDEGPRFSKEYNNAVAAGIKDHPDRFAAFAHLPMTAPEAAADELERCVNAHGFKGALINGLTENLFLDSQRFAPILQRVQELDVPIYLHPNLPPRAVADAYYSELPGKAGTVLSIAGWGWHSETAIHVLRLIISGTFDRYPGLKLIIGHMGEMLPVMMARCDQQFEPGKAGANQRSVSQTLKDQVHITTSGIFTLPPLMAAIATFGIDNIMFSVDYPFSKNEEGRAFLNSLQLPESQLHQIAHGNAERLLKL